MFDRSRTMGGDEPTPDRGRRRVLPVISGCTAAALGWLFLWKVAGPALIGRAFPGTDLRVAPIAATGPGSPYLRAWDRLGRQVQAVLVVACLAVPILTRGPRRGETPVRGEALVLLRATQAALLLLLYALYKSDRHYDHWPIVAWPMYRELDVPYPPPFASEVVVRAIAADGVREFPAERLFHAGAGSVPRRVVERAFDPDPARRDAHRSFLAERVVRALPGVDVEAIEAVRVDWEVAPSEARPVRRDRPPRRVVLGRFPAGPGAPGGVGGGR